MQSYLNKHAFIKEPLIGDAPHPDLSLTVVIPALAEDHLLTTLSDLVSSSHVPTVAPKAGASGDSDLITEVIVVINHSESASSDIRNTNLKTYHDAHKWAKEHDTSDLKFHILYQPDLPVTKAGVGLARKIGMDEAVRRFVQVNNPDGVIACLDADCRVQTNYLHSINAFFSENPKMEGCSIRFEHSLDGLDEQHRKAIVGYDQHLRYFISMQRWAGLPYAYQTIGSSMAIRAGVHCKVGGMNTRQAGEDFYFLHKVIGRGAFGELDTTTVFPSTRISDRVPFGTGRAMKDLLESGEELTTYHPRSFIALKAFIDLILLLYPVKDDVYAFLEDKKISPCVINFLKEQHFDQKLVELQSNTASESAFVKRFFHWFDAFRLIKYVHYTRDEFWENVRVEEAMDGLKSLSTNLVDLGSGN